MAGTLQLLVASRAAINVVNTYDTGTAATETIPNFATKLVIEAWGGGAGAGKGRSTTSRDGGGGGSGGYSSVTYTILPGDWLKTFTYSVAASVSGGTSDVSQAPNGNNTTVANGTFTTALSITAGGGAGGQPGQGTGFCGTGGTATGGTTNTAGLPASSTLTNLGKGAPNGGGDQSSNGSNGTTPGGGGCGGAFPVNGNGGGGAAGRVRFTYT
jgi:hypothetical protein